MLCSCPCTSGIHIYVSSDSAMKIASHSNGRGLDHVGTCPIHYFLPPYMTSDASGGHLLIPLEIWRLTAYCRHRKSMSAIQTQTEKGSGFSARLPQPSSDLDDPPAGSLPVDPHHLINHPTKLHRPAMRSMDWCRLRTYRCILPMPSSMMMP